MLYFSETINSSQQRIGWQVFKGNSLDVFRNSSSIRYLGAGSNDSAKSVDWLCSRLRFQTPIVSNRQYFQIMSILQLPDVSFDDGILPVVFKFTRPKT